MDGFSKYHFKDLADNEKIIKVIHRNWFYLFQQFFVVILAALFFVVGLTILPVYFPQIFGSFNQQFILFVQNFFILALWIYGFMIWIDYYFDIWIITTERVVNIEQKGMFDRRVSETTYSKIQDITTDVTGFIPTVLNFGDLRIQTAGEAEEFIFRTVSDPYHIKNIIIEMQKLSARESTEQLGEMIKEKIQA